MLFLAKEHAGHLYPRAAGRHLPDTERDPSPESPLDCLGAHQPDDRLAVFGYGELTASSPAPMGKRAPSMWASGGPWDGTLTAVSGTASLPSVLVRH